MPVSGGLKAESGRVGRDFGPLLRAPTPGEMGGVVRVAIVIAGELPAPLRNTLSSHFPTFL